LPANLSIEIADMTNSENIEWPRIDGISGDYVRVGQGRPDGAHAAGCVFLLVRDNDHGSITIAQFSPAQARALVRLLLQTADAAAARPEAPR
jgi:hypothetical protein